MLFRSVNDMIAKRYEDYCLVRRMFVDLGFMRRENGIYQLLLEQNWPTYVGEE